MKVKVKVQSGANNFLKGLALKTILLTRMRGTSSRTSVAYYLRYIPPRATMSAHTGLSLTFDDWGLGDEEPETPSGAEAGKKKLTRKNSAGQGKPTIQVPKKIDLPKGPLSPGQLDVWKPQSTWSCGDFACSKINKGSRTTCEKCGLGKGKAPAKLTKTVMARASMLVVDREEDDIKPHIPQSSFFAYPENVSKKLMDSINKEIEDTYKDFAFQGYNVMRQDIELSFKIEAVHKIEEGYKQNAPKKKPSAKSKKGKRKANDSDNEDDEETYEVKMVDEAGQAKKKKKGSA